MPGEKHFTVEDLVKKLSVNKQNLEYFIRENKVQVYLSEAELIKFLEKVRADVERSKNQRKETEARYQERLKKIPREKEKYDGGRLEL